MSGCLAITNTPSPFIVLYRSHTIRCTLKFDNLASHVNHSEQNSLRGVELFAIVVKFSFFAYFKFQRFQRDIPEIEHSGNVPLTSGECCKKMVKFFLSPTQPSRDFCSSFPSKFPTIFSSGLWHSISPDLYQSLPRRRWWLGGSRSDRSRRGHLWRRRCLSTLA